LTVDVLLGSKVITPRAETNLQRSPTVTMSQEAANAFIRECWGLQGASYLVLGLRYTHQFTTYGMSNISGDDILMFLATLVYTAESVAAHFVVAYWKGLANNGMTDEQRAALDPSDPEYELRVNGSKTHVIGLLLYATLLWILKGCWIFYYGRLGSVIAQLAPTSLAFC
jgi:hypothetical protein